MKMLMISALMAGGALMAATNTTVPQNKTHLSYDERIALETSSPRVKVAHMYHRNERANSQENNGYKVVKDKTTINAFVPRGK